MSALKRGLRHSVGGKASCLKKGRGRFKHSRQKEHGVQEDKVGKHLICSGN